MSSASFQVCLTAVGHGRKIVELGENDTVENLYSLATKEFKKPCEDLRSGFPPKSIATSDLLARNAFVNNDRVTVILAETRKKGKSQSKQSKAKATTKSTDSVTTSGKRPQRAAAKAASESFADVIRAQDKMMQATASKRQRTTSTAPTARRNTEALRAAAAARRMAKLPGRRLADGADVSPATTRRKKPSGPSWNSKEDVSVALFQAIEDGGGGKVGQVLRGAMRSAVHQQYEASRAVVRVAAVQAEKYQLTTSGEGLNNQPKNLVATYDKGVEGRGEFEDSVDFIPREALESVMTLIHGTDPETLRATTLAQLSPRVFWSLLYHATCTTSVEDAMQELMPQLDWSFLRRRKQTLSEKAKENLRQEQEANGEVVEENLDRAAEAVEAVEKAMSELHDFEHQRRRQFAARAALSRQSETTDTWTLETPTEEDEEELLACVGGNRTQVEGLRSIGICNWRQLAMANAKDVAKKMNVPVDATEKWIDHAQQESIDEIIVEVCDGRVEVVQALQGEAHSGTPKDLANWRSIPDVLYQSSPTLASLNVAVEDLKKWCERSHQLVQQHNWMSWYATPVA